MARAAGGGRADRAGGAMAGAVPTVATRYLVVDEQRAGADAVPPGNLMRAVLELEQSRSPADLARVASALTEWLAGSEHMELRGVFVDWLRSSIAQFTPAGEELPEMENLEDVRMTLEERVKEWPAQWLRPSRRLAGTVRRRPRISGASSVDLAVVMANRESRRPALRCASLSRISCGATALDSRTTIPNRKSTPGPKPCSGTCSTSTPPCRLPITGPTPHDGHSRA